MFKKILVPLDGSELAFSILPQVAELAKQSDASLTLIHVVPDGKTPDVAGQTKVCEAYLALVGKELQSQGLKVDWVCVEGVPPREIIRYAEDHKMDLIAMATHGKGEVAWLLGSTAAKVTTHATVPVMLFRILFKKLPPLKGEVKAFI